MGGLWPTDAQRSDCYGLKFSYMINQKKIDYGRNQVPLNMETLSTNIPFGQKQLSRWFLLVRVRQKVLGPPGLALVLAKSEEGKMNRHI